MPLVFVHGVSVREEFTYHESVAARDALFRRLVLDEIIRSPKVATILNPYWGEYGAKLSWEGASLPEGQLQVLGAHDGADDQLAAVLLAEEKLESATERTVLLELAKTSLTDAVDVLFSVGANSLKNQDAEDLTTLSVAALDYARHNASPDWLFRVDNDEEFLRELEAPRSTTRAQGALPATTPSTALCNASRRARFWLRKSKPTTTGRPKRSASPRCAHATRCPFPEENACRLALASPSNPTPA